MLKRHEVGNLTQHSWSDNPNGLTVHPSKGPPRTMELSCHDPSPPAVTPHAAPEGVPEGRPRRAGESVTDLDRGPCARGTSSPRRPLMGATIASRMDHLLASDEARDKHAVHEGQDKP